MANLDFSRTTNGAVKEDKDGNVRYLVNGTDVVIESNGVGVIGVRNGPGNFLVQAAPNLITNINGTPFSGTLEDAKLALADTVFTGA